MISNIPTRRTGQRGFVLFTTAAVIVALIGFAGLVFDVGQLQYQRHLAQMAADAGALGGAKEWVITPGDVVQSATADVQTNGFSSGNNGATVQVNVPPLSGTYVGQTGAVEVIVSKTMSTSFMSVLGFPSMTVKARAVSRVGPSIYCVIALDPSASGALSVTGSSTVSTPGCAVMVDSSSSTALYNGNAACLTASEIDVTGGYTSGSCAPNPTPNTGLAPLVDPFKDLAAPTVGGCDYTNYKVSNAGAVVTLNPGVYCGGITVSGNNATLALNPGVYILNGGGIKASGGDTITGTGITFYNTAVNGQKYSDIQLTGGVQLNLSAPTSGTYEGILFFQDRAYSGSSQGNVISGTSGSSIDGVLYFPNGSVTFTGNSSQNGYTNIVAQTITFSGNNTLKNDYSTLQDGAPMRTTASLVE